ncbi:MAG: GtrA family protein [Patescibacteria group bacterium]|nr:GtrA family protein [Patescibacteria group bacterium]
MLNKINKKLIIQFSKFVVIGFLNTGIDFAVLNLLMWQTGIYSGKYIILLNAISFSVAVINSYFWNKFWIFRAKESAQTGKEFAQFITITLIGMVINTAIVYSITTLISPMFGLSAEVWANLAKVAATGVSLIWNFTGYKLIVFKK